MLKIVTGLIQHEKVLNGVNHSARSGQWRRNASARCSVSSFSI